MNNLSQFAVAPPGTAPLETGFGNVPASIGAASSASQRPEWGTVFRGVDISIFYKYSETSEEIGNLIKIRSLCRFRTSCETASGNIPTGPGSSGASANEWLRMRQIKEP